MAILNEKLYIVRENSSRLTIYNCKDSCSNFHDWKSLKVKELVSTSDMCSSNSKICLYIMDRKTQCSPPEILRISPQGICVKNWSTKGQVRGNLSATADGNVIITACREQLLLEYSFDGDFVREIKLPHCPTPSHAIKLGDRYIVGHGGYSDPLRRVCLVDADGNVHGSFGDKIQSMQLTNIPLYLAVGSNRCVIAADVLNNRVLLLDSNLVLQSKLVPKYKQKFSFPYTISLGGTLLVVLVYGDDPNEATPSEAGDSTKQIDGAMTTKNNNRQIDKDSRILVFDIKSILERSFK